MGKYFKNTNFLVGFLIVSIIFLIFVISFFYLPKDPYATNAAHILKGPSAEYPLGTDHLGRDVLSRVMKAIQVAFFIGISTMIIGGFIGVAIGMISGYVGGVVDDFLMRIVDVFMTIPGTILILLIVTVLGRGMNQTIFAISLMNIPVFAKMTRSQVLSIKNTEHILWAKSIGVPDLRIIFWHILPDLVPVILVVGAMKFSSAIMAEAGLSYLGLGVQQPEPSLGNMLTRAQGSIMINPFTALVPGFVIILFVLGFNLLSDGIRDVFNSREE